MPDGVFLPGVRLQERVLLPCARLHVMPTRPEHVLARVNQPLRVPDRVLVHRVGGHARILTAYTTSLNCSPTPPTFAMSIRVR